MSQYSYICTFLRFQNPFHILCRGALRANPRDQGVLWFGVGGRGEESKHDPPGSCGVAQHELGLRDQGDGCQRVYQSSWRLCVC